MKVVSLPKLVLTAWSFVTLQSMAKILVQWTNYTMDDFQLKFLIKYWKGVLRRILKESQKLVKGSYSRQLVAAYAITTVTAPGESYLGQVLRFKLSQINERAIQEMEDWRERRLGYQKSQRDLFAI